MADRSSIQNEFLEAMQLVAVNEVKKMKFDKTVLATVWKIEDESLGKYLIKDQDSFYTAYSSNLNVVYKEKESVYVSIPESNYSNTKLIVGSVNQLGSDYVQVVDDRDKVNLIGINCFNTDQTFGLKSATTSDEKKNYIDILPWININAFKLYIIQSIGLMISMDVMTSLEEKNVFKGNYGLKLTCKFYDNNEQDVYRTYYLDTTKMVGNPFKLTTKANQYAIFDMDVDKFQEVTECILFAKDFAYDGAQPDIFISDIQMNFVEALTEEELSSYSLNLRTSRGTIFSESSDDSLPMVAELKIKGKNATLDSTNSEFYWFVEDASIDFDSYYYSSYGDRGWRCLNDKLSSGQVSYFVTGKQEYRVKRSQVPIAESVFKGVVVYNGVVVSETKKFQNLNAASSIEIESSKGFDFYFDAGSTELTCKVINSSGQEISNNFTYAWGRYDVAGAYVEKLGTSKTITIEINSIEKLNTFRCSVFNADGSLYGTGTTVLTNKTDAEPGYTMVINNANRLYYYDENGDAPSDPIPQLTLTVYDPKGNEIDLNLEAHRTKWTIPTNRTLLTFDENINLRSDTLSYKILPRFDKSYINNTISVEMSLRGVTLTAETALIFTKEGDIGTNGTSYYCRLVPVVESYNFQKPDGTTINRPVERIYFIYLGSSWKVLYISTPDINNDNIQYTSQPINFNSNTNYYKALLYKEGRVVSNNLSYSWYVGLGSGDVSYNSSKVFSAFTVSGSGSYCKLNFQTAIDKNNTENIIKVKVKDSSTGNIFYSAIAVPLVVDKTTSNIDSALTIAENGFGFDDVVYNNDGTEPKYSVANFIVKNKNISSWIISSNLRERTTSSLIYSAYPIDPFISEITNNYIKAYISDNCFAIFPVIMHLNTSGIGMLNDWDGSKYGVNGEEGDYILAPQIGAGIKDNNNMFTGLIMGEVRNRSTVNSSNRAEQVGLFGYTIGKQMFSLTPYNSIMKLGLSGNGQIIFDGTQGMIESGTYQTNKTGLRLDIKNGKLFINSLTGVSDNRNSGVYLGSDGMRIGTPSGYLSYSQSNNTFFVKGDIKADTGYIGGENGWTIKSGKLYSGNKDSITSTSPGTYLGSDGISIGNNKKYMTYNIDKETLTIKGDMVIDGGKIGGDSGWVIKEGAIYSGKDYFDSSNPGAFLGSNDGIHIGTQTKYLKYDLKKGLFEVKGTIEADEGHIGGSKGWTIATEKLYMNKSSVDSSATGIYLGSQGLSIGGTGQNRMIFKMSDGSLHIEGDLYANTGYIGGTNGWTIKDKKFYMNKSSLGNTSTGAYFGNDGICIGTSSKYMKFTNSEGELEIKGIIKADAGKIGGDYGWTITSNAIYTGTKNSLSASGTGTYLGSDGIFIGSSSKYMKYANGELNIKGDIIADTIEAEAGYIGGKNGWKITSEGIYTGDRDSIDSIETGMYLGSKGISMGKKGLTNIDGTTLEHSAFKFKDGALTITGEINATSGVIGGWRIDGNNLIGIKGFDSMIKGGGIETSYLTTGEYYDYKFAVDEKGIRLGQFLIGYASKSTDSNSKRQWFGAGAYSKNEDYEDSDFWNLDESPVGMSSLPLDQNEYLFWAGWTKERQRAIFFTDMDDAYLQPDRWQGTDKADKSLSELIDMLWKGGGGTTPCNGDIDDCTCETIDDGCGCDGETGPIGCGDVDEDTCYTKACGTSYDCPCWGPGNAQ